MDRQLRDAYRRYAIGDITSEQLLRAILRAGEALELLDVTSPRHNPISVIIDLGYDDIDYTTFGVWDFDEVLYNYAENAPIEAGLEGQALLDLVPELASVFQEVEINLNDYKDSIYLEYSPGTPPFIAFQVSSRLLAANIFNTLEHRLGIERQSLSVRQYQGAEVIWDESDALRDMKTYSAGKDVEDTSFKGRIALRTDFLQLVNEEPNFATTMLDVELRQILDTLVGRSEELSFFVNEAIALGEERETITKIKLGVVSFAKYPGLIANTDIVDWNVVEAAAGKKSAEEVIELIIDVSGEQRHLYLTNFAGEVFHNLRIDEGYYSLSNHHEIVRDMLESMGRWERKVIWLPQWVTNDY